MAWEWQGAKGMTAADRTNGVRRIFEKELVSREGDLGAEGISDGQSAKGQQEVAWQRGKGSEIEEMATVGGSGRRERNKALGVKGMQPDQGGPDHPGSRRAVKGSPAFPRRRNF